MLQLRSTFQPPTALQATLVHAGKGKRFTICSSSESDSLFLFQLLPSNSENPNTPAYPPLQTVLSSATREKSAHAQFSAVCDSKYSAKRQEGGKGYGKLLKETLVINIHGIQPKNENLQPLEMEEWDLSLKAPTSTGNGDSGGGVTLFCPSELLI